MAKQKTVSSTQEKSTPMGAVSKASNQLPSHEQIAKRAYELFLARGGTHGRHQDDWAQAERELRLGRQ